MVKRKGLFLFLCVFTVIAFSGGAQAQEKYPRRPIELVVGYAPGGINDVVARIYCEALAKALKVKVTLVNRPGGGGIQGTFYVARAKKDGYTLLSGATSTMIMGPILTPEATFETLKDFFPLGYFGNMPPQVFVVRSDSPIKSFREMVEYARKNPGKLKTAVGSIGTAPYLDLMILCAKANVKINIIPFKSGGESAVAILGGHVDMNGGSLGTLGPHVKAGTLRALAITTEKRYPPFPNIPTTAEEGYPYVNYTGGIGLFAPAGLPQTVLRVLIPAVEKIVRDPAMIERAATADFMADYKNPEEFRKYIESESRIWGETLKDAGLSVR